MASPPDGIKQPQTQQLFVRADEVDTGTTITAPGSQKPLSALTPADGTSTTRPKPPPRPVLKREGSTQPPPPPSQPPPAPPGQLDNVTDSLSLPQLRQLVSQFPKSEQRAYAYQYRDVEDYATEVDEWFHYTEIEQDREYLLAAREAFEQRWRGFCDTELHSEDESWTEIDPRHRSRFVRSLVTDVSSKQALLRQEALASIYYVLAGLWSVTAGIEPDEQSSPADTSPYHNNAMQIKWMHEGAGLVVQEGAIEPIYASLRAVVEQPREESGNEEQPEDGWYDVAFDESQYREMSLCLACLYLIVESARTQPQNPKAYYARQSIMSLQPSLQVYLVGIIARLRWDESHNVPLMHVLQLLWKSILLIFGDTKEHLPKVRNVLQPSPDRTSTDTSHPILTASPLDYHSFRQEVTSKYPAYNPPPPLIPLEIDQKSMLPPLPNASRQEGWDGFSGPSSNGAVVGSILHQPVHIATPAPSPPPSPAGPGGKGGKKQNYQTNQNFPFLYPPLDSSSNNIGGKGTAEYQDAMVGKKWEGSDIPASIIEAGELFASRMRMTRAMKQLWKERDLFMKYDRGWNGEVKSSESPHGSGDTENLDDLNLKEPDLQSRMTAVNDFFHQALPNLQSLIIVMMKVMLTNVQDIAVRNGGFQEGQNSALNRNKSNPNLTQSQSLPVPPPAPRPKELPLDELDNIRSREISQKAISGTLYLLLKWFKMSHVLQFEYMTQLLLDSNYIQLTLKYFAHQNLEDLVAFSYDRQDLNFWHYCHLHSDHPPLSPTSPESHHSEPEQDDNSSADDAIPPPIQRHRRSPASKENLPAVTLVASPEQTITHTGLQHPTVDELGNPNAPLPQSPITEFSARQFQTSIQLLRTLQKLTKAKSHRILLLVQFKSSQILRRILRVPDPLLRLYVLKLFKSQVPYCGRKWRQSNMRVITAIYLHCRPELRDEWLAGMHDSAVEGEVDEAVPLEWALRGLTFWWMKRRYPDVMKQKALESKNEQDKNGVSANEGGQEVDDDERDFFQRELDAMGWGMAALNLGAGEDVGFGEEAPGASGPVTAVVNGINGESHHQGWDGMSPGGAGGMDSWS